MHAYVRVHERILLEFTAEEATVCTRPFHGVHACVCECVHVFFFFWGGEGGLCIDQHVQKTSETCT